MSRYIITGGIPLKGEVHLRGAKNAAFKQIIASLLTDKPCLINNLPQISDTKITEGIASSLGAKFEAQGKHSLKIQTKTIKNSVVPFGTGQQSRTSFMFAAPLLLRCQQATIPFPGGDRLGVRPLDRLFDAYAQMNIKTEVKKNCIFFSSSKITPTTYTFPKPSHTVTEVLIMTSCLVPGLTTLNNAALEPEIDDLILFLNKMGAKIKRHHQDPKKIIIHGVKKLKGVEHSVISDRNEAVTFACAALATKGSIQIMGIKPQYLTAFLNVVENMGAKVERGQEELTISWAKALKPCQIETEPEPGFMTDWQAVFSVLLTQSTGVSSIIEKIFPYRFHHLGHLEKMGARFKLFNPIVKNKKNYYCFDPQSDDPSYFHGVKIYGPCHLKSANLSVTDLRSGASLTLAALIAEGQSIIDGVEFIERGYEDLAQRLVSLGANIKYVKSKNKKACQK